MTLCDPMDCSSPGSSVHEILQARILEWGSLPFSRESSWLKDRTWVSCITGEFFTVRTNREAPHRVWLLVKHRSIIIYWVPGRYKAPQGHKDSLSIAHNTTVSSESNSGNKTSSQIGKLPMEIHKALWFPRTYTKRYMDSKEWEVMSTGRQENAPWDM